MKVNFGDNPMYPLDCFYTFLLGIKICETKICKAPVYFDISNFVRSQISKESLSSAPLEQFRSSLKEKILYGLVLR